MLNINSNKGNIANKNANKTNRTNIITKTNLSFCNKGQHEFIPILFSKKDIHPEEVVRWCPICGAIRVDSTTSGQIHRSYVKKLQLPDLAKEMGGLE